MKTLKIPAAATSIRVWISSDVYSDPDEADSVGMKGKSVEEIATRYFGELVFVHYDVDKTGWSITIHDTDGEQIGHVAAMTWTDIFQNERFLEVELEEVDEPEEAEEVEEDWEEDWAEDFRNDPNLFRTDGTVDFYFLSPELHEGTAGNGVPNNWLFCGNEYWADAFEIFAENPPTAEEMANSSRWDEARGFVLASINQNLSDGFEIIEGGWIAHVNPERRRLPYAGVRAIAGVAQWRAMYLSPVMDYAADIIRKK